MMNFPRFSLILLALSISACGGGGDSPSVSASNSNSSSSPDIQTASGASGTLLGANDASPTPEAEAEPPLNFTVSWVAPVQREDATPISLSEIAGYKVYSGLAPDLYTDNVTIEGSSTTTQVFTGFDPGTYFFSVTTLDADGRESEFTPAIAFVVTN